jgi:undecaprenyl-phosphate 4-deoxy-4-formamido-L-arabinose transferase
MQTGDITLSIVIRVFEDEAVLTELFDRLYPVLDGLGQGFEAVFVDDGSRDRSATLLRQQYKLRPDSTRVVYLRGHVGQYGAILAGLAACVGRRIVTLDADLETPPEDIRRLLAEMELGHDYVRGVRRRCRDPRWSAVASRLDNWLWERMPGVRVPDQGCMVRAYDRDLIDAILASDGVPSSIPALAYLYAANPTEILVGEARAAPSKCNYGELLKSMPVNLSRVAGLTAVPLQVFSLVAMGMSVVAFAVAAYLVLHRLTAGPGAEGVSAWLWLLFVLAGVLVFGMGLLGTYVGRLSEQIRGRPRYLVREELTPRPAVRRSRQKTSF